MRFLIYIVLFSSILSASHISWQGDYESAHREALKQNKHLLILLVDKKSEVAGELIQSTFMNQEYIQMINTNFIAVLVTKGQNSSYPIELLYTLEYPALFFLDKYELYSCKPLEGVITPSLVAKYLKFCF